jgi:hypothetical protein
MAASSNESFGLKIATSFSIALTVVLLVAVYFLNSYYTQEAEKNVALEKKTKGLGDDLRTIQSQSNDYRTLIGLPLIEDFEAAKAQMKKDNEAIKTELQAMQTDIATTVEDFKKKMEGKGADASQFEALKQRSRELVDGYVTNANTSYIASLARLKDLTINQARLSTNVALNYIDLRRELELANKVNSDMKKVVEEAYATAKAELDATIKKDEEARSGLVTDTQAKAEQLASLETKLTNITNELQAKLDKKDVTLKDLNSILRDYRDQMARKEDVMSKPGGRITFVDYGTKTVRVSVNKNQGVRPLMRFTIFDKNSVGITSDRPKAAIELVKIGDPAKGEYDSVGRIVNTFVPTDPVKYNDFIFSVGWSHDHPQRFALIGKIDVNRDGRDDRGELIRMIEAAGGVVEFDLPPPGVDRSPGIAAVSRAFARFDQPVPAAVGRAAGKISGLAYAYITDTRPTLILNAKKDSETTKDDASFLQEESTASQEARSLNVRPLPLEKLLNMLGYEYSAPVEGRREAFDRLGTKALIKPKGVGTAAPPSAAETPAAEPAMPETPK